MFEPHYTDWLLYGITEEFLLKSPCFFTLFQKELFDYCQQYGVVMIQAYPYRQSPCEPKYMHGVEINCSDGDLDKITLVEDFAKAHNLLVACGLSFCGTDIPWGDIYP